MCVQVKFDPKPAKFFIFAATVTLLGNAAQSLGLCIAAAASNLEAALQFTPVIIMPFGEWGRGRS